MSRSSAATSTTWSRAPRRRRARPPRSDNETNKSKKAGQLAASAFFAVVNASDDEMLRGFTLRGERDLHLTGAWGRLLLKYQEPNDNSQQSQHRGSRAVKGGTCAAGRSRPSSARRQ